MYVIWHVTDKTFFNKNRECPKGIENYPHDVAYG